MSLKETRPFGFSKLKRGELNTTLKVWFGDRLDVGDGYLTYGCSIQAECAQTKEDMDVCSELVIRYGLDVLHRTSERLEKELRKCNVIED